MKSKILPLVVFISMLISCKGQNNETVPGTTIINETIETKAFAEKLKSTPNQQIIDVRSPQEFNSQHLDNALNINFNSPTFDSEIGKLDKSKPTFVYCLSGGRSGAALSKMKDMGFVEVYNMEGGMKQWNSLGLSNSTVSPPGTTQKD